MMPLAPPQLEIVELLIFAPSNCLLSALVFAKLKGLLPSSRATRLGAKVKRVVAVAFNHDDDDDDGAETLEVQYNQRQVQLASSIGHIDHHNYHYNSLSD